MSENMFGVTDFNAADPATVARLATQSSLLVTEITESQREAIRAVLAADFGRNPRDPRDVALDILGRISKVTGRREGGIVGLASHQSQYVSNARDELATLDPRYFGRTLRDKRFDKMVRKAIDTKTPLTNAQIDKIAGRYSDRLLMHRGETIGRTETLRALNQGRDDAMSQAIDAGTYQAQNVTKVWCTAQDSHVRDAHAYMEGQTVAMGKPFEDGDGNMLMYPGDPTAPPETSICCRCYCQYNIDFIAEELG